MIEPQPPQIKAEFGVFAQCLFMTPPAAEREKDGRMEAVSWPPSGCLFAPLVTCDFTKIRRGTTRQRVAVSRVLCCDTVGKKQMNEISRESIQGPRGLSVGRLHLLPGSAPGL